jgi:hypothetical protein
MPQREIQPMQQRRGSHRLRGRREDRPFPIASRRDICHGRFDDPRLRSFRCRLASADLTCHGEYHSRHDARWLLLWLGYIVSLECGIYCYILGQGNSWWREMSREMIMSGNHDKKELARLYGNAQIVLKGKIIYFSSYPVPDVINTANSKNTPSRFHLNRPHTSWSENT